MSDNLNENEVAELLVLKSEERALIKQAVMKADWSQQGKVKVQKVVNRGGKQVTQTFWVSAKQAQEMGAKPTGGEASAPKAPTGAQPGKVETPPKVHPEDVGPKITPHPSETPREEPKSRWGASKWAINTGMGYLNPKNPKSNEFIADWGKDLGRMYFTLVQMPSGSQKVIGSFGDNGNRKGDFADLRHSQTNQSLGIGTVVGEYKIEDLIPRLKGSTPLYSYD